jgi:hypothetical protein
VFTSFVFFFQLFSILDMDKDSVLTLDEVKIASDEVSISLDEETP